MSGRMDPLLGSPLFGNPWLGPRTVSPVYFGRDVSLGQDLTGSASSADTCSPASLGAVSLALSHVAPTAQNALPCFPLYEILQASQTSSTVTPSLLLSCSYSN